MRLTRLEVEEFRSYRRANLELPPAGLRIHGSNASGKTTVLEAIYLLATTRSSRTSSDRELINWSSAEEYGLPPYARVYGRVQHDRTEHEVEVAVTADQTRGPNGVRKRIRLDGRPKRAIDVVGTLKVVLFEPEDLNLVLGSPSVRRRYLDISLSQIDQTYLRALSYYGRILEQRNSLLKDLSARRPRDRAAIDEELSYWNGELVTRGGYVVAARLRYLSGLSAAAADAFRDLAGADATLDLRYIGTVQLPEAQVARILEGSMNDAQILAAHAYESEMLRVQDDELRRGVTLVGPHRDDFRYLHQVRDLSAYGSRGQQRLAVVATKLAELHQVVTVSGERPVLMLDDVLSELDPRHQDRLLAAIGQANCQVVITSTDPQLLDHKALAGLPLVEASSGTLVTEAPY